MLKSVLKPKSFKASTTEKKDIQVLDEESAGVEKPKAKAKSTVAKKGTIAKKKP